MKIYNITPVAKPRMTQSDKWKKRKIVLKYRAFRDEVRLNKVEIPESGSHIVFIIPMPESWKHGRKFSMNGTAHRKRPDKDNLEKALLDAVFGEDCMVWDSRVTKIWGYTGKIIIDAPFERLFTDSMIKELESRL